MSPDKEKLVKYLRTWSNCPICCGSRSNGGHKYDCPLEPYQRFIQKDIKVGDHVYIHGGWDWFELEVTKIIDDYSIEAYEKSIGRTHILKSGEYETEEQFKNTPHWYLRSD